MVAFIALPRVLSRRLRGRQPITPAARSSRQLAGREPELVRQHVVGVLAEPRHPGLGALGDLGELHREPGDQHRLVHAVGPRVLDEHVAAGQVGIGHHLGVGGDRARPPGRRR